MWLYRECTTNDSSIFCYLGPLPTRFGTSVNNNLDEQKIIKKHVRVHVLFNDNRDVKWNPSNTNNNSFDVRIISEFIIVDCTFFTFHSRSTIYQHMTIIKNIDKGVEYFLFRTHL